MFSGCVPACVRVSLRLMRVNEVDNAMAYGAQLGALDNADMYTVHLRTKGLL